MAQEQRRIVFFGQVQGVGFRYSACRIADRYDLTGYVRNLPDGAVECLVEGEDKDIDTLVADLRGQFSGYIRRHTQQTGPYTGRYHSFGVQY